MSSGNLIVYQCYDHADSITKESKAYESRVNKVLNKIREGAKESCYA